MLLQKDKNLAVILNNPNWLNAQSSRHTAPYWGSSSGTGSLRREAKWMRRSGKGIRCYNSTVNEPDVTRRPSVRDSLGVCMPRGKMTPERSLPALWFTAWWVAKLWETYWSPDSHFYPPPFTPTCAEHFALVFRGRKWQLSVFCFLKIVLPLV